jgi:CheY-like chemotaxis protein
MLRTVLTRWGYEVNSVPDGEEAWNVLQLADAPQLLILDWIMPRIDGFTLCGRLRAKDRNEPLYIILVTSKGEPNDIVRGLEAGADDYVTKPYDLEELRARIGAGRRVLELLHEVARHQKLQGVLEMAGAVCHELNQPLHVVSGYSEMLLADFDSDEPQAEILRIIKSQVDRIGELTRRIMRITKYSTKDYLGGRHAIVDIDEASSEAHRMV